MSVPKIRVCVPYPNHGSIHPKCQASLNALRECKEVECEFAEIKGSSISQTRNIGVTQGKSYRTKQTVFDFDYYLNIDSDIEFKPEDVIALIYRNVDIVSGAYVYRGDPNVIVAGYFNDLGIIENTEFLDLQHTGMKEVDWVGAGFLLVHKGVLERLKYPWFRERIIEYTNRAGEECAQWVGEDTGFCMAAKEAGYKIYVDCNVKVNHLTEPDQKPLLQFNKDEYTVDESMQIAGEMMGALYGILGTMYKKVKTVAQVVS